MENLHAIFTELMVSN